MNNNDGFIDIHAHILPGVDDGAQSMEETVRMLLLASQQQIETILATPHYAAGCKNTPVEELNRLRELVQEEAQKLTRKMRILLGNELYYSGSILDDLKSGKALTLAGSRYVLVEFSVREDYSTMFKGLGEMIRAGYSPIIAHVERYRCLHRKEYLISELIEAGCYIQMNSDSLAGGIFNTEAIYNRKLVNQGLVHFIGSDCHNDTIRIPSMKSAEKILRTCDKRLVDKIFYENPFKVLENTYI